MARLINPRKACEYLALIDPRWLKDDAGSRHDEYEDLLALLLDAAKASGTLVSDPHVVLLAQVVARACMGDDHLWHDLGLPSRRELSSLLIEHFATLARANTGNMRWKKFFYLKLCERAEIRACRAPTCGICVMQAECFGDETLPLASLAPSSVVIAVQG
ncbi:MAG: nitrogen fixation protein NifQ [Georgfuchsia sp.]